MLFTGVGLRWQEHLREYAGSKLVRVEMYYNYLCYAFVSNFYRHTNTYTLGKLNFGHTRSKVPHL